MAIQAVYRGLNISISDVQQEILPYFEGALQKKLMLPRCGGCGLLRWPASPGCPWCSSMEHEWQEVSGEGTIYSYEIVTQAVQSGFKEWTPYPVVLVELDEQSGIPEAVDGLRIWANLVDNNFEPEKPANVAIGKRVEMAFLEASSDLVLPQWRLSGQLPRGAVWQHASNLT